MIIFLITFFLSLLIVSIAEGEKGLSDVYQKQSQKLNNDSFSYEDVSIFTSPAAQSPLQGEIEAYVRQVFGGHATKAIIIAKCESGLNPNAVNWDDSKITGMPSQGIFQINAPYNEMLFNWKYNVDVAYKDFFLKRGFQPWSCAKITGVL